MKDAETTKVDADLACLDGHYRVILCDIWGCIHDGVHIFPEAEHRLREWRREGRIVLLITNAPRPAKAVCDQLATLGLDRAAYDEVISSGDTGIAALRAAGYARVGFIGTASDRTVMRNAGMEFADGADVEAVVCIGLPDGVSDPADLDSLLARLREADVRLLCFNPDRVVLRGGVAEACAGAIADRYEAIGGRVDWFGKPYRPIYDRALEVASAIAGHRIGPRDVAAVGDSLRTDLVGAAGAGFAFIFITHGIEGELIEREGMEVVISRFASEQNVALPPPIAVASRLA